MVSGWWTQNSWIFGALLASGIYLGAVGSLRAREDPARICDAAAEHVAQQTGVPLSVLHTIAQTETGPSSGDALRPWPWTVNMQGKGVWFDTEDQARAYVFRHFKQGARNFDVGCFQINYRWHGQAFNSIEEMFDPLINARYAAEFLGDLYSELGDWAQAADTYHSRTQKSADRYMAHYTTIKQSPLNSTLPDNNAPVVRQQNLEAGVNSYSFLQRVGVQNGRGSLVPLSRTGKSLFADRSGS